MLIAARIKTTGQNPFYDPKRWAALFTIACSAAVFLFAVINNYDPRGAFLLPAVLAVVEYVFALIYLRPAVIAKERDTKNRQQILVFNLLFGWTVVGWIILMVIASRSPPARDDERLPGTERG